MTTKLIESLFVGASLKTVGGMPVRIISVSANIGKAEGKHHSIVALVQRENGDDFIEWYNVADFDEENGILRTEASSYQLDLKTIKNDSASIDDMIEELRSRGWTANPYPLEGVPLSNGFDINKQQAYVSFAEKILVSEFPSAYYMALFLERVLEYDMVEHVSPEIKGAYNYFLIDAETYVHEELNGEKDVPFSASQVACTKLDDYTHKSFVRKVRKALSGETEEAPKDEVE